MCFYNINTNKWATFPIFLPYLIQNVHVSKVAMLEKFVELVNSLISETSFNQHTIIKRAFTYLHAFTEHLLYAGQNFRYYHLKDTVSTLWSLQLRGKERPTEQSCDTITTGRDLLRSSGKGLQKLLWDSDGQTMLWRRRKCY